MWDYVVVANSKDGSGWHWICPPHAPQIEDNVTPTDALRIFGAASWELVAVTSVAWVATAYPATHYYFKRPL